MRRLKIHSWELLLKEKQTLRKTDFKREGDNKEEEVGIGGDLKEEEESDEEVSHVEEEILWGR